ncbi:hypothetical protein NMG60_11003463, partial [Bertholletia excelsa]
PRLTGEEHSRSRGVSLRRESLHGRRDLLSLQRAADPLVPVVGFQLPRFLAPAPRSFLLGQARRTLCKFIGSHGSDPARFSESGGSDKEQFGKKATEIFYCWHSSQRREFCWVTQEDIIRFLLSSIGLFSPIPAMSVDSLGLISSKFLTIGYHAPALSATGRILLAAAGHTSVAVVDDDGLLIGEISPAALNGCGETAAAAIATLSAGDLMAYIDGGSPPEDLIRVVEARLRDMDLKGMLEEFAAVSGDSPASSSSSEDEELQSPTSMLARLGRYRRSSSFCVGGAAVCQRHSSLAAVTIQAISHRVNYIWVVEEDGELIGIVTFPSILGVFHECLESMA